MDWSDEEVDLQTTEFPIIKIRADTPGHPEFMDLAWSVAAEWAKLPLGKTHIADAGTSTGSPDSSDAIWSTDHIQRLLAEPVGSPVELSRDEARAILRASFDTIHDLPKGAEFHQEIRESLGHGAIDRVNRSDG